jgi:serine/threonine-protein kinase
VTPDWRLKVVDFGIARALATISPDEHSEVVWGSPQYFSPEQAAGGAPSPASDVYSLGVVLYEMLAGRLPFTSASPQEMARLHREALPPSPRKFNPDIPLPLEQILLKVLLKEPSARYRTADQLGRVLANFRQQNAWATPAATAQLVEQPAIEKTPAPEPQSAPAPQPVNVLHPPQAQDEVETPPVIYLPSKPRQASFDWITWLLALLALIAVGGLVPFCLWVYYVINPPV